MVISWIVLVAAGGDLRFFMDDIGNADIVPGVSSD